jgi:hypothetical protein
MLINRLTTFGKPILILLLVAVSGCVSPAGTTPSTSSFVTTQPLTTQPVTSQPGINWEDLSVYKTNLVQSEQGSLDSLHGASVYHLDVTVAPDFKTISGEEQVRYINQETVDLTAIYFRLFANESGGQETVSAVMIDGKAVSSETVSSSTALKVTPVNPLKPGQGVTIQLSFVLTLPVTATKSFGLLGYFNGVLALDSFFPIIPVYDQNGWHIEVTDPNGDKTYNDAAFFLANIKAPESLTLVASGVEVAREKTGNNQVITFADGPARDFYLAAGNNFSKTSSIVGETTINSYYLPGEQTGANKALSTALDALKVYTNRFGVYPYIEFDIVPLALSGGGIGMEYPGVVGVAMGIYDNQPLLEDTVAHEVGHQWFFNVVGNDQVNQPWVDESMTQYVTGLYQLDIHGQTGWDGAIAEWNSFWNSDGKAVIPIGKPVSYYPGNKYGAIVYGRGPLFVSALANLIGGQVFADCLRGYYQHFKWQIATTASFQDWFQSCSGKDLSQLFQKWVLP